MIENGKLRLVEKYPVAEKRPFLAGSKMDELDTNCKACLGTWGKPELVLRVRIVLGELVIASDATTCLADCHDEAKQSELATLVHERATYLAQLDWIKRKERGWL